MNKMNEMNSNQQRAFNEALKNEGVKLKKQYIKNGKLYYLCVNEYGDEVELSITWAGDKILNQSWSDV